MDRMVDVKLIETKAAEKDWTLARLERKADIANGTIRRWADTTPQLDTIQKVADALGCRISELLAKDYR